MTYKPGWKAGEWSAICDVCGFRHKAHELRKRWDNLMVCEKDWEVRNLQDFVRVPQEKIVPDWVRPEATDEFGFFCTLWARSAYADLAEADCSLSDNTSFSYPFLFNLKQGI